MRAPLDPKITTIAGADFAFGRWCVRLPDGINYADVFVPQIWAALRKQMKARGDRQPRKDDLIRIIGRDFDATCVVSEVSDEGYSLTFYAGQRPAPLVQVLADLDALPALNASELKAQAKSLQRRWQAIGASRQDLDAARRRFAVRTHPDTTTVNGSRLAAANALIDYALESLGEAA